MNSVLQSMVLDPVDDVVPNNSRQEDESTNTQNSSCSDQMNEHQTHSTQTFDYSQVSDCVDSDEETVYVMMDEEPEIIVEENGDDNEEENDVEAIAQRSSRSGFLNPPCLGAHLPFTSKEGIYQEDYLLGGLAQSVRHNWTYVGLLDHFKMQNRFHNGHPLPRNKRELWTTLNRNDSMITRHYLCKKCQLYLGKDKENLKSCPCIEDIADAERKLCYFYQVDLVTQLREILQDPQLTDLLQYRFNRRKKNENAKEDIYDGDEFQKLSAPGNFLHNPFNFPLGMATDGAPVADSSTSSAWPTFIQFMGLPPHFRKKYMLLASVYVGLHHPVMSSFMKPVMDQLQMLYTEGIEWTHPRTGEVLRSKFVVTTVTVDLPARCLLTRMTSLNGKQACLFCYIKNEKFVYAMKNDLREMRTEDDIRRDMRQVHENKKNGLMDAVRGFQGISPLVMLPDFKITDGVVVDVMHCAYLGVIEQHTDCLLSDSEASYYIGSPEKLKVINGRLLAIRPPTRRSRVPRDIRTRAIWKASEWRNFLDYAPICFYGILPNTYLSHLAQLSQIIHMLNNVSVTSEELDEAELLVRDYVTRYERNFGEARMKPVVHLLTHIVECVRKWGPLWVFSAFVYEAMNRRILEYVSSPGGVSDQIVTRFLIAKFMDKIVHDDSISEECRNYIKEIMNIHDYHDPLEATRFKVVQKGKDRFLTDLELENLPHEYNIQHKVTTYQKVSVNGVNYECADRRITQHCDSVIYYDNTKYGTITSIVEFQNNGETIHGFFVNPFEVERPAFGTKYIKKVRETRQLIFWTDLEGVIPAITMSINDEMYAVRLANCFETD